MTVELKTARGLAARVVALALAVVVGMALAAADRRVRGGGRGESSSRGRPCLIAGASGLPATVTRRLAEGGQRRSPRDASFAHRRTSPAPRKAPTATVDGSLHRATATTRAADADYLAVSGRPADYADRATCPNSAGGASAISPITRRPGRAEALLDLALDEASANGGVVADAPTFRGTSRRGAVLGAGRHRVLASASGGGRGPLLRVRSPAPMGAT